MASKLPSDVTATFFDRETLITPEKLSSIKLELMSQDPASMITAVSWIKLNLKSASDSKRECLIEALIENDALTFFCEKIASAFGDLLMSMLEIVRILISHKNFYKKKFAKLTSSTIIQASFIIAKNIKHHEETLSSVVLTLYKLFDGASKAQVPLEDIYCPDKVIAFLERLDPKRSTCYYLRLNAARMLCLIIPNIKHPISEQLKSSLFKTFRDSLLYMGKSILDLGNAKMEESIQISLEIICRTCAVGIRLCKDLKDNDIVKEITCTMIHTVIPQYKRTKFDRDLYEKSLLNLISCLDEIFKFENIDKELANVIAAQGYLKYFLEIPVPRKLVSSLSSRIIGKLAEDEFSQSNSHEELAEFEKSMSEGILELPSGTDVSTMLQIKLILISDAFLILLYYHAHKSHEYSLVPPSPIVFKVMSIMSSTIVQSNLVLKATWFLFMVSSKDLQLCSLPCNVATNLAQILKRYGLRECYTHNRVLLDCSLNCENFPTDLKHEILQLWFEFNGDIKPVLESPNIELIDDCLLKMIETGSEQFVNRALEVFDQLKSNKQRWKKICERAWERLPEALAICSANTALNVKELLCLAQAAKPGEINLDIYKETAPISVRLLTIQELDNHLKILILLHVSKLLKISIKRKSFQVVESCVKYPNLITVLRDQGLSREHWPLAGCCLTLLVEILDYQNEFKIQSSETEVVKIDPGKVLVLLARSNYELSSAAVRLLTILLNREQNFIMTVALNNFENTVSMKKITQTWYQLLHQLFPKKQMKDWHLIFRCLISVLNFCDKTELYETLQCLCDYSCTYDLVRRAIDHEYSDEIFFIFLDTWLGYADKHRSLNIVIAQNAPTFVHSWTAHTEFEEIIQMIIDFKAKMNKPS